MTDRSSAPPLHVGRRSLRLDAADSRLFFSPAPAFRWLPPRRSPRRRSASSASGPSSKKSSSRWRAGTTPSTSTGTPIPPWTSPTPPRSDAATWRGTSRRWPIRRRSSSSATPRSGVEPASPAFPSPPRRSSSVPTFPCPVTARAADRTPSASGRPPSSGRRSSPTTPGSFCGTPTRSIPTARERPGRTGRPREESWASSATSSGSSTRS